METTLSFVLCTQKPSFLSLPLKDALCILVFFRVLYLFFFLLFLFFLFLTTVSHCDGIFWYLTSSDLFRIWVNHCEWPFLLGLGMLYLSALILLICCFSLYSHVWTAGEMIQELRDSWPQILIPQIFSCNIISSFCNLDS